MKITIEIFNRVINEKWGRVRIANDYSSANATVFADVI